MAVFAAVIVISCNIENPLPQAKALRVTGSILSTDNTRVSYTNDSETHTLTPRWTIGDRIFGIDDNGIRFDFTITEVLPDGTALFDTCGYRPDDASTLHAIYFPGHSSDDLDDEDMLTVDLSAQDCTLDPSSPVLMLASASVDEGQVHFSFAHNCSIIGLEEISVSANANITEAMLGGVTRSGTVRIADGKAVFTPNNKTGMISAKGINIACDKSGKPTSPIYFPVFPTKDAAISVSMKCSGTWYNNVQIIHTDAIEAGMYYRIGKKLSTCRAMIVETGMGYPSFEAAVEAANSSTSDCTIRIFSSSSAVHTVIGNVNGAKTTIDLAGCKISMRGSLEIHSKVEITDSSTLTENKTGTGEISCSADNTIIAGAGADLTISNGNITGSNSSKYVISATDGADLTIRDGAAVTATAYRPLIVKGTVAALKNTIANIDGGWFQCPAGQCNVVITRETTSGYKKAYLNVSGGHFKCTGSYSSSNRCFYRAYTNCSVSVFGGFFDTDDIYRYYKGEPENYTASGCELASTKTDWPDEFRNGYCYYVRSAVSEDNLSAALYNMMEETGTVNLSVLAYRNGSTIYEKAFGYRCKETGNLDTLEVHDVYRIASISKNFVGAAMMVLLDRGLIDLDADVNDFFGKLPEGKRISVRNPHFPDTPITIRMLLNHTSSITGSPSTSNPAETLKHISYTENKPGTAYEYTNMGSAVAAAVVELASGRRLDEFVKENLLDRIGMPHSGFDASKIDTSTDVKFVHLYRAGKERYFDSVYSPLLTASQESGYVNGFNTGLMGAAGNMKSSLEDLARWAMTFQRGGITPEGVRVISEENVLKMINSRPQGINDDYGFFTMRNTGSVPGTMLAGHNGSAYGAFTYLMYGMDQDASGNALPVVPGSANDWGVIVLSSGNLNGTNMGPAVLKLVYSSILR